MAFLALLLVGTAGWVESELSALPDPGGAPLAGKAILVYDRAGKILAERDPQGQYHVVLRLSEMGRMAPAATLAAEDRGFYRHGAVDLPAVARAAAVDVVKGRAAEGGSTITQQLVKIELLGDRKSIGRKLQELILAYEIEHRYSKDQILELYLNRAYYGHGAYGIGAAAQTYFGAGTQVKDLTAAQAALLAGLLNAPTYLDPFAHFERARERQLYVLQSMQATGALTPAEERKAEQENVRGTLKLDTSFKHQAAPHFVDWALGELERKLGSAVVHQGGLAVYTTIDAGLQDRAEQAVTAGVADLSSRGVNNGDLLAADPQTGAILSWVGSAGYDKADIGGAFDVVVSPRQPGSSFKPYVYMAALRDGRITWSTCLNDSPQNFGGYRPHDFDNRSLGVIPARTALLRSRNIPAVEVASKEGIDRVIGLAHAMGVKSSLDASLPTAIGASDVSLLEQVQGYQVLAAGGKLHPLYGVARVVDRRGSTIFQQSPGDGQQVISPADAYLMASVLKDYPATWGFNWRVPMAAKTGTTDTQSGQGRDAWIMAYNPDIVAGAWTGHTGPDGAGGTISAYGESVATTVMARFVNGLAAPRSWYARPANVVSRGGYDYLAGTENQRGCGTGGDGGGNGHGEGQGNGGGEEGD